jgi:CheY-like chemotaxis protein
MRLHDAALPVQADPVRIAQVINNLLTNASKYTPRGGHIELIVDRDRNEAMISVIDDGIGIPPEALESVFDMFSQVGRNMHHAQGGLGIGLSLVRQLVDLHGGTVAAHSEGVGRGSSFVVRLPLVPALPPADTDAATPDKAAVQRCSLRVLVTDDNADAAMTLAALLEMHGHQVHVANDGPSALDIAARTLPQLVFLDIGMPGMSGYEVAHRMRRIAGLEHCAIVAVTGWGTADDRQRSKEAGFDAHFTKPLAPADLVRYIDSLLPPA